MFFFAPNSLYDYKDNLLSGVVDEYMNSNYRLLTRNSNKPYTDYGMYWEALVVREPFSDSFIDTNELRTTKVLKQIQKGMTPDWNLVYHMSTVNGYTTLLPVDYSKIWQASSDPRINFVDMIALDDPKLAQWSVKYYLVDNWFEVQEDLSKFNEIAKNDNWTLYELEALSRFRHEDDTEVNLIHLFENPNMIEMEFKNIDKDYLIIADRYDDDWQVYINDKKGEIENYQGMRRVKIESGVNKIKMVYRPKIVYIGALITGLSFIIYMMILKFKKVD